MLCGRHWTNTVIWEHYENISLQYASVCDVGPHHILIVLKWNAWCQTNEPACRSNTVSPSFHLPSLHLSLSLSLFGGGNRHTKRLSGLLITVPRGGLEGRGHHCYELVCLSTSWLICISMTAGGWFCAKASNPTDPLLGSIICLKYT